MRTLFAFLVLSSASAFCQQNDFPPYPGYPETRFAPVHKWSDVNLDVNRMANSFGEFAIRPRSYAQFLEDNKPKLVVPPVTQKPIVIRDSRGRITGSVQTRGDGVTTVRDSRGRVTQTATVRAGTVVVKESKSSSARKAK